MVSTAAPAAGDRGARAMASDGGVQQPSRAAVERSNEVLRCAASSSPRSTVVGCELHRRVRSGELSLAASSPSTSSSAAASSTTSGVCERADPELGDLFSCDQVLKSM